MLTISQLAAHAGVTVRAVRHYHQIGLLPEPERDHSGYRTYDAAAVVRLIQIRTLAEAGVPLARVQELLDATPEDFAKGVKEIDKELRAEIRRLQDNRKRIARLAAGESLALPQSAVDYLDTLRRLGVDERYIELERDAWIMVAARVPDLIDSVIAKKRQELADPDMVKLYRLLSEALDWPAETPGSSRSPTSWSGCWRGRSTPARSFLSTSMTPSWTYSTRRCSKLHRSPGGCWPSWRSGAGGVGLASSACLQNEAAAARATRRGGVERPTVSARHAGACRSGGHGRSAW